MKLTAGTAFVENNPLKSYLDMANRIQTPLSLWTLLVLTHKPFYAA